MKTAPDGTDRPIKPSRKNKKKPNKKDDVIQHKYTNKIVSYSEEGISILEKKVNSVCKKGSDIQEKKIVKKSFVKNEQNAFDDTLEIYGFEKGTFCACKFVSTLSIPHMKEFDDYPVASLKKV